MKKIVFCSKRKLLKDPEKISPLFIVTKIWGLRKDTLFYDISALNNRHAKNLDTATRILKKYEHVKSGLTNWVGL
jgi:hypothetical protein